MLLDLLGPMGSDANGSTDAQGTKGSNGPRLGFFLSLAPLVKPWEIPKEPPRQEQRV